VPITFYLFIYIISSYTNYTQTNKQHNYTVAKKFTIRLIFNRNLFFWCKFRYTYFR